MEIIELPPQCFVCKEFHYNAGEEELYECKALFMGSNDIFELWEECPFLDKKYLVREPIKEG